MFIYALKYIKTMKIQVSQHLENATESYIQKEFNLTKDSIKNAVNELQIFNRISQTLIFLFKSFLTYKNHTFSHL